MPDERAPHHLGERDFAEIAGGIGDLARSGLPLVPGLRAMREEIPSRRVRRALSLLSNRLEQGESLEAALQATGRQVPEHMRGLLEAGVRSGNLALVLEQYLIYTRAGRDMRRRMWFNLGYPVVLIVLMFALAWFMMAVIVPQFREIFEDFGVELPMITELLLFLSSLFSTNGLWIALAVLGLLVGAWLLARMLGGSPLVRRALCSIPLIGPPFRYTSLSEFCHLLGILVENHVQLPEALRMAGSGSQDSDLRQGSRLVAGEIERGESPDLAALRVNGFPRELAPVFRWSQQRDAFADALHAAGEIFGARAHVQSTLVAPVLEPVIVIGVAVAMGFMVIALFLPLIKLLNDLS